MSDSWENFALALHDESQSLSRLGHAALRLQQALVENDIEKISTAERDLDAARQAHVRVVGKRRGIQVRGFGTMPLRQVCGYAPRHLAPTLNQRLSEITTQTIALGITSNNNKALIVAGMERLIQVTTALQKAARDDSRTYKRRGFVPPPSNSVLVSSSA